jgi:hypothetical protein
MAGGKATQAIFQPGYQNIHKLINKSENVVAVCHGGIIFGAGMIRHSLYP